MASRVLPKPPAPSSVSSRQAGSASVAASRFELGAAADEGGGGGGQAARCLGRREKRPLVQGEAVGGGFAEGRGEEAGAYVRRHGQVIGEQGGHLAGGTAFVAFDFGDGDGGAVHGTGQVGLGEVERQAAPAHPVAKGGARFGQ